MQNIFSEDYRKSRFIALASVVVAVLGVCGVLLGGVVVGLGLIALPFLIYAISRVFLDPRLGILTLFVVNYFVMGVSRYVPGPLGLTIDGIMVMTYLAIIFRRMSLSNAFRDLTLLALIWYAYALFELVNPEAHSRQAWFYAMRGFSLYFLMTVPLTFVLLKRRQDMELVIKMWSVFTILALIKGMIQEAGFIDYAEHQWLVEGGAKTHIVAGRLRIFSFFTDAGQFGASMAFSGVVFSIVAMGRSGWRRWYYFGVAAAGFVGMFLSGTRGAIAVPAAGFVMYILLSGKGRQMVVMGVIVVAIFGFFKFTNIGNSNYQIARMRTAFNGQDASLQARLANQAKLRTYLVSRPFGGGIGSAGNWGQRFSPGTFLADVPTDSWYVAIWAEQGIVGLSIHLCILFYVLIKGFVLVKRVRDPELGFTLKALLCGLAGVVAASYSNGVMGQMPTGVIVYMSMAFIFMAKDYDNEKLVR